MGFYKLSIYERQLDSLYREVSQIQEGEINKAHLTRYLCVRTSGYLENVARILIAHFCDGTSPQPINNYIAKRTKYITNLDFKKLKALLSEFDTSWSAEFEERVNEQQRSSLNSVISNRNNISHGNQDSITYRDMVNYYRDVKDICKILIDIIKK
ncbi:MAE_28990/MAE_18760 family HEPN-like nuclease [Pontimicrobium sp. MEBiC06410]